VALAIVDASAKFEERGFIPNLLKRGLYFKKGHVTLFKFGNWIDYSKSHRMDELCHTLRSTIVKFEERSFIHSRNIEGI